MPRIDLTQQMQELEKRAKMLFESGEYDHSEVCRILADRYELWDDAGMFPVWLSRVVAGVEADLGEAAFIEKQAKELKKRLKKLKE